MKMTAKEYNAKRSKPSKYKSKRITVDGVSFHSKAEAARWRELKLLEREGKIAQLECQVPIELWGRDGPILTDKTGKPRTYVADFRYIDWRKNGVWVIEDKKGFETPEFKLKRAILSAQGVTLTLT